MPHGVSSPSATSSILKACFSLFTISPGSGPFGGVGPRRALDASSWMNVTRARIWLSESVALKDGIAPSARPSRMLAAMLLSSLPKLQRSSIRLCARPPAKPGPWHAAHVLAARSATLPGPGGFAANWARTTAPGIAASAVEQRAATRSLFMAQAVYNHFADRRREGF